ncbi:uncharacterized protein CDAR_261481 [Caerostris darwini]|uniref:EF-hand domain-containing protein n=1 Tax=Caerostris darwini TaxID=1538125 RepID=A0AAV4SVK4_9ARAC|nr:uncharacterized protein CDAR_261481 [Caerostris darwini]
MKLHLTEQMVIDFQKAYTILDFEGNGTLNERDIKVTLRALGIEPNSKSVKKLIEKVTKKTDKISRENFEKIMLFVINDIDSDDQMEQSFQIFNTEDSETISINRLKEIASTLRLDLADEETQEMILMIDGDEDGIVTKEEFLEAARKIF